MIKKTLGLKFGWLKKMLPFTELFILGIADILRDYDKFSLGWVEFKSTGVVCRRRQNVGLKFMSKEEQDLYS